MRRQSSGRNAHHYFMLSGFPSDRKVQLWTKIKSLGGIYNETDHFDAKCTHIVCKKPSKSEKFLGGCATGKWLVTQQYIDDSYSHGRWLVEASYEWSPIWRDTLDPVSRQFLVAPRKWRNKVTKTGKGAFVGWRVVVLVDHVMKRTVYTRLLELGGATVLPPTLGSPSKSLRGLRKLPEHITSQAESLTHVFVEGQAEQLLEPLAEKGVFCLRPMYIGDFLLLEPCPTPENYLVTANENVPIVVKTEPDNTLEVDVKNALQGFSKNSQHQSSQPLKDLNKISKDPSKVVASTKCGTTCTDCGGSVNEPGNIAASRNTRLKVANSQHGCKCSTNYAVNKGFNTSVNVAISVKTTNVQKFYATNSVAVKETMKSKGNRVLDFKAEFENDTGRKISYRKETVVDVKSMKTDSKELNVKREVGSLTNQRRGRKRLGDGNENHPMKSKVGKYAEVEATSNRNQSNNCSILSMGEKLTHNNLSGESYSPAKQRKVNMGANSSCKADLYGARTPVKTRSSVNRGSKKTSKDSPALQRLSQSSLMSFVTRCKSETTSPVSCTTQNQSPWKLSQESPRFLLTLRNDVKVEPTLSQTSEESVQGTGPEPSQLCDKSTWKVHVKQERDRVDGATETAEQTEDVNRETVKRRLVGAYTEKGATSKSPGTSTHVSAKGHDEVALKAKVQGQSIVQKKGKGLNTVQTKSQVWTAVQTTSQGQIASQANDQGRSAKQARAIGHTVVQENIQGPSIIPTKDGGKPTMQTKLHVQTVVQTRAQRQISCQVSLQGQTDAQSKVKGQTAVKKSQSEDEVHKKGKGQNLIQKKIPGQNLTQTEAGDETAVKAKRPSQNAPSTRSKEQNAVKFPIEDIDMLPRMTLFLKKAGPSAVDLYDVSPEDRLLHRDSGDVIGSCGRIESGNNSANSNWTLKQNQTKSSAELKGMVLVVKKLTHEEIMSLSSQDSNSQDGNSQESHSQESRSKSQNKPEILNSSSNSSQASDNKGTSQSQASMKKRGRPMKKKIEINGNLSFQGVKFEKEDQSSLLISKGSTRSEWNQDPLTSVEVEPRIESIVKKDVLHLNTSKLDRNQLSSVQAKHGTESILRKSALGLTEEETPPINDVLCSGRVSQAGQAKAVKSQQDVESVQHLHPVICSGRVSPVGQAKAVKGQQDVESVKHLHSVISDSRTGKKQQSCRKSLDLRDSPAPSSTDDRSTHEAVQGVGITNKAEMAYPLSTGDKTSDQGVGIGDKGSLKAAAVQTDQTETSRAFVEDSNQCQSATEPAGNDCAMLLRELTEEEVALYAAAVVRKQKIIHHKYGMDITESIFGTPSLDIKSGVVKAFPLSENYTALFEACLEETLLSPFLEMLHSSLSTVSYPLPRTLHTVMAEILLTSENLSHREKAYDFMMRLLSVHPPVTAAMQSVYFSALQERKTEVQAWTFVQHVIRTSLTQASEGMQEFYTLKFLVTLFEQDFQFYQRRLYTDCPRGAGSPKGSLWGQVLWPVGTLAMGQLNSACQELLRCFVEAFSVQDNMARVNLVSHLQSLVAMAAESCRLSFPAGGSGSCLPLNVNLASDKLQWFSRELVRQANNGLDRSSRLHGDTGLELLLGGLRLPWLTCLVCSHLLQDYDESLLPLVTQVEDRTVSLKKIVSQYFYLLPPLNEQISLHKKKNQADDNEALLNSKRGSTPRKKSGSSQSSRQSVGSTPVNTPNQTPTKQGETPSKRRPSSVNKRNGKGETALHRACITNNLPRIKELLQTPGLDVNLADYAGWTPLHECCNYGYVECVSALLQYRPAPTITTLFNKDEENKRVNLLACSEEGITPLHDAVENNHLEVVRLLLEHGGKKLLEVKTGSGQSVFDLATSPEMRELLQQTTFRSPIKRRYAHSSHSDFTLSQSYLSQTMTETCDFLDDTYQPIKDRYTQVLNGTARFVAKTDLKRFVMIVFYLLKNYLEMQNLIEIWKHRQQHEDKQIHLGGIVTEADFSKLGLATNSLLSQQGKMTSLTNHKNGPGKICPSASDGSISKRGRPKRQGKTAVVSASASRIMDEKRTTDSVAVPCFRKKLLEDLEIYRELKFHIRGFKSHLKTISQKADSKEAFDCELRLYLLAMRALHLA